GSQLVDSVYLLWGHPVDQGVCKLMFERVVKTVATDKYPGLVTLRRRVNHHPSGVHLGVIYHASVCRLLNLSLEVAGRKHVNLSHPVNSGTSGMEGLLLGIAEQRQAGIGIQRVDCLKRLLIQIGTCSVSNRIGSSLLDSQ